VTRTV